MKMKTLALLMLLGTLALGPGTPPPASAAPAGSQYVVLHLDGMVQPVMAEYIERGLALARQMGAPAVVIELSTPGGLDTSMHDIIQAIFASPVPVIGYVAPSGARAASAGFYILLSCDVAAMAPGTNTGAAHPVVLGGEPDAIEAQKMQNDAAAYIRTIANERHRNVDLAQQGVVQSRSFTEQEALQGHLIDLVADSLPDLMSALNHRTITRLNGTTTVLDLTGAKPLQFNMNLRERVLNMDSSMAFILLAIGALFIYLEFTHPGMFVPGVVGVILVAVSLFSLSLLPISYAGVSLLILALVLFGLEAKFPTHGVLAVGGVVCMALGAIMLVNSPEPSVRVQDSVAWGVATGFGIVSMLLLELVLRARRRPVTTGPEGLIGELGIAPEGLHPAGQVQVHGEIWQAVSVADVPAGGNVRVRAVHGLRLDVEPAPHQYPSVSPTTTPVASPRQ